MFKPENSVIGQDFFHPKQPQQCRSLLEDRFRFLGLFWKRKPSVLKLNKDAKNLLWSPEKQNQAAKTRDPDKGSIFLIIQDDFFYFFIK